MYSKRERKKKSDKCVLGLLGSKLKKNIIPKRLLFVGKDLITLEKK